MPLFMAINTKRFQIVWMVCTALIEFKCMMDMTFIKACRMFAILAQSTITFIDELAYLTPLVNGHSREPGISFVVQDEFIHTIPRPAIPYLALPRRAQPCLAKPLPQRRYPCLTSPSQAVPSLALPRPALTTNFIPNLAISDIIKPKRVTPCAQI